MWLGDPNNSGSSDRALHLCGVWNNHNQDEYMLLLIPHPVRNLKILCSLLAAFAIAATVHAADEIRITSIAFTDANFTTIQSFEWETVSGSGVINDAWTLDDFHTNFIAGGEFTKVYATGTSSGVDLIEVTIGGTHFDPPLGAPVSGLSASGTSVNNVFRLDWDPSTGFAFSKLSDWSDGGVDGVSGKVNTLFVPSGGGRIYIGGWFQTAGGYAYGRGFAYYRLDGYGWHDVRYYPMYITGPSYAEILDIEADGSDVLVHGNEDVESYVDQDGYHPTYNYYVHATWLTSSLKWSDFYGPP